MTTAGMRVLLFIKILIALFITSCVQAPESDTNVSGSLSESDIGNSLIPLNNTVSAIILNEGLWGLNNSDITLTSHDNVILSESYIAESANKYIGDTASDIVHKDGKLYIAVTISNKIIELDLTNNTISDILFLPDDFRAPRAIAINDEILYVTDQFEDKVIIIDISNERMEIQNYFNTGPAPEDILIKDDKVFVANSGYGDFRANEEKSGFITSYSLEGNLVQERFVGMNLVNLQGYNNNIIAGYLNTPENLNNGEMGGIKIINPSDMSVIDSVELDYQRMTVNEEENKLYVLTTSGVLEINLDMGLDSGSQIIANNSNDIWYEIALDNSSNLLYISNAKNHQVRGEVLIYSLTTNSTIGNIPTGINPSDIIFLEN